ncbi:MAG: hypothetical protein JSU59_08210 [Nitrospirota bacterium]|nr:MAG: hypothetical protein JSU59_08210 [Nitrospirota bacterium]
MRILSICLLVLGVAVLTVGLCPTNLYATGAGNRVTNSPADYQNFNSAGARRQASLERFRHNFCITAAHRLETMLEGLQPNLADSSMVGLTPLDNPYLKAPTFQKSYDRFIVSGNYTPGKFGPAFLLTP